MQMQGLVLALSMLILIPLFTLFSNHNIYFLISSILTLILAVNKLRLLAQSKENINPEKEEIDGATEHKIFNEDLENILNIDMKKFEKGIFFVKNLFFILFFIYCIFYIESLAMRIMIFAVIWYWTFNGASYFLRKKNQEIYENNESIEKKLLSLLFNSCTIFIIIIIAYNKFIMNF